MSLCAFCRTRKSPSAGALLTADRWIADGDLGPYDALPARLDLARHVVVLDPPLWLCCLHVLDVAGRTPPSGNGACPGGDANGPGSRPPSTPAHPARHSCTCTPSAWSPTRRARAGQWRSRRRTHPKWLGGVSRARGLASSRSSCARASPRAVRVRHPHAGDRRSTRDGVYGPSRLHLAERSQTCLRAVGPSRKPQLNRRSSPLALKGAGRWW